MLMDEEDTALNEDDGQSSTDSADGDQNGSDDASKDGSADDTGADDGNGQEGQDDGTGDGADDTGDKKKPMIPKDRFDEVITERNAAREESQRLQGQVDYLAQMIAKQQSGEKVTEKQQDKAQNNLDALVAAGKIKKEDAERLQEVIDAMGYRRGDDKPDSRVEGLEKKVDSLTKMLGEQADSKEKEAVLKKYGDLITEDDLNSVMKEWAKSKDPDLRHAAENWSYEKIVKLAFHDKIVANEVDKALKGKKKPAPKIDGKPGDKSPKKPQKDDFEWEPGDGASSSEALKRDILADLATDSE